MFTMREYKKVESVKEAWEILNAKKPNTLLGGTHFLKMGKKAIATGIDLQSLELNYIKKEEGNVIIGAMASLRAIEENEIIALHFGEVFKDAFAGIVGIQLRNTATIGASVHARYGFSDPCLVLLTLDAKVRLYGEELISMEEYLTRPVKKDFVQEIIIPIKNQKIAYKSYRKSATDLSVLNVCVAYENGAKPRIAVGARPKRAILAKMTMANFDGDIEKAGLSAKSEISVGSNMRGSKEYRSILVETLVTRALKEVI